MTRHPSCWLHAWRAVPLRRRMAHAFLLALALFAAGLAGPECRASSSSVSGDQRLPSLDIRKLAPGTRVNVDATQFTFDSNTNVGTATGEVVLTYGPYLLVATEVSYDQDDDIMRANGEVRMREPNGNILETDLIELQNKFRDGFAEKLRLLLTNDATVQAEYAKRTNGNVTVFTHAQYTRCKTCVNAQGVPLWQIRAEESTHVETDHRIYHRNARFEILGFPVFYTPYFSNPDGTLNNQSGLLTPTLSHSPLYGWGVTVPYILSLDPSYDITFMPMITSEFGIMPRAQWRQRLKSGSYSIDAAGIDEGSDGGGKRGVIRTLGAFDLNSRWQWGFDLTGQTDDTFARHYKVDSRKVVTDKLFVTGIDDRNYFSARAMQFRDLVLNNDEEQANALPYVEHEYTLGDQVAGGELSFQSSFYRVTRKDFVDQTSDPQQFFQSTGQTRGVSVAHWESRNQSAGGLLVTNFANLRADAYQMDETPTDPDGKTIARLLPSLGIDVRFPLISSFGDNQQVITPVAQLISAANETHRNEIGNEDALTLDFDANSLFLSDRFTGLDRYEGGTRANLGMQYSLLGDNGEFLRASLGQSYHLAGDNSFATDAGLERNTSDIVAAVAAQPFRAMRVAYQLRANPGDSGIHAQEAWVTTRFERWSLNGGFADLGPEAAYGRDDLERQLWASGSVVLSGPWSLFGGAHYDIQRDAMIRDYVGVGFDCDCMNVKLYYTEDYDNAAKNGKDRSLLFAIEVKTLGATRTISPF